MINDNVSDNITKNRNKYIGGSDIPALFNVSEYKSYYELAKEKAECLRGVYKGSEYTRYGQLLEPFIRDYVNAIYNLKFRENTAIDDILGLRSNCDGLDKEAGLLLEIKTNGGNRDTIEDYVLQMQLYMYQFNVSKGYLVQYKRPDDFYKGYDFEIHNSDDYFNLEFDENRITIKEIDRDNELIKEILRKAEVFWNDVERLKANPEMTEAEFYFKNEIAEYRNTVTKLSRLENELQKLKNIENEAKEQREILYDLMQRYNVKTMETEHLQITRVSPTQSVTIDSTKLREDQPELIEKYSKVSNRKGYVRIKCK